MKKFVAGLVILALIAVGTIAFGHDVSSWGGGMMGFRGYGSHMMGPGYGGHMMEWRDSAHGDDQKFLNETHRLRKELHEKGLIILRLCVIRIQPRDHSNT